MTNSFNSGDFTNKNGRKFFANNLTKILFISLVFLAERCLGIKSVTFIIGRMLADRAVAAIATDDVVVWADVDGILGCCAV